MADNIAQTYHYIEDGLRYDIIRLQNIWETALWSEVCIFFRDKYSISCGSFMESETNDIKKLTTCRFFIKYLVNKLIEDSRENIASHEGLPVPGEIRTVLVRFNEETQNYIDEFYRNIVVSCFFANNNLQILSRKYEYLLRNLFGSLKRCPEQMPSSTFELYKTARSADGNLELRVILDHISGMTDRYAINTYNALFNINYEHIKFNKQ